MYLVMYIVTMQESCAISNPTMTLMTQASIHAQ